MDGMVRSLARRHVASISRQEAVERAEAYMWAHISTRVPLPKLCRLVGLSERGLREAFYSVRGLSPRRWSVGVRLQCVREALTDECAESTTVTDAAADYGFYELGRFAALYREAFGEAPSDTLRSMNHRTAATSKRIRTRQCLRQLNR